MAISWERVRMTYSKVVGVMFKVIPYWRWIEFRIISFRRNRWRFWKVSHRRTNIEAILLQSNIQWAAVQARLRLLTVIEAGSIEQLRQFCRLIIADQLNSCHFSDNCAAIIRMALGWYNIVEPTFFCLVDKFKWNYRHR